MSSAPSDHVLSVADLVGRPGTSRPVDREMATPDDLELPLATVVGPVHLGGVLESVVDGILVRATLRATFKLNCARCLREVEQPVAVDVVELFSSPETVDPDDEIEAGYEIADLAIDLDTLLRDALVPAVPYQPLCRAECKGLCDTCGIDLNTGQCDCAEERVDPRWAVLSELELPGEAG